MIGMSQIRKRLIYGILIGVGIGIIGIAITLIWSIRVVNSYKDGTNKEYRAKYTTEVVMLNRDVIQGETITDTMLTTTRVHISATPTDQAGYNAVGKIAKYNIPANIPLVNSMFGTEIVSKDERIQEINTVNLPTDLVNGDYIDIKIKMASGLEYVVIPQIKVEDIRGTTVFLHLNEEDLYYLNSAIVDTYLSDGAAVLYGVRYVDPTTQIKIGEDIKDEEGITASDRAKIKLSEKIEQDVANGTTALKLPATVAEEEAKLNADLTPNLTENSEPIAAETENTQNEEQVATEQNNAEKKEYINFSNNLTDLLLKYAIEYRYYVESFNKIERTYQPSSIVMEHMRTNKYIADEAKEKLSSDVRRQIEAKLDEFQNSTGEGYEAAISGLTNQITVQQTLRNSTLNAQ